MICSLETGECRRLMAALNDCDFATAREVEVAAADGHPVPPKPETGSDRQAVRGGSIALVGLQEQTRQL